MAKLDSEKIEIWIFIVLIFLATVIFSRPVLWPAGGGFGQGKLVTNIVEKDDQGNLIKSIETTKIDNGKTLWDWLSLLGVPLSLLIFGYKLRLYRRFRELTEQDL